MDWREKQCRQYKVAVKHPAKKKQLPIQKNAIERVIIHSKSEDLDPNYPAKKLNFPQICPKMPQNGPKMA